jgi:hypothetical protein
VHVAVASLQALSADLLLFTVNCFLLTESGDLTVLLAFMVFLFSTGLKVEIECILAGQYTLCVTVALSLWPATCLENETLQCCVD